MCLAACYSVLTAARHGGVSIRGLNCTIQSTDKGHQKKVKVAFLLVYAHHAWRDVRS